MKTIILILIFLSLTFICNSQSLEKYGQDKCSVCIINPMHIDSIDYQHKIDSISYRISQKKENLSDLYRLKGDYFHCLSNYNFGKYDSIFKPLALNCLMTAIVLDSNNWRAYHTLVDIYLPHAFPEKNDLDSANKYCNLLVKANDTIGDSYLQRAGVSIYRNELENTLSDLRKARQYKTCSDSISIKVFESLYYLYKCDFMKFYYLIQSAEFSFDEDYGMTVFVSGNVFDYYPFIKDSLIIYLKHNSKSMTFPVKAYLKDLIINNFNAHNLNTSEIEKL